MPMKTTLEISERINYQRENGEHYEQGFPVFGDDCLEYLYVCNFLKTQGFKDLREKLKASGNSSFTTGYFKKNL